MTRISTFVRINTNKLFETIRMIRPKSNKSEENLVLKWPNERENRERHVEILSRRISGLDESPRRLVRPSGFAEVFFDESFVKRGDVK